jgi:hypothetical protein
LPRAEPEHPAVEALRARQDAEDTAYAAVLDALDAVARAAAATDTPIPARDLEHLNASWAAPERPKAHGIGGALQTRAWDALGPALERQAAWNAALVRVLNAQVANAGQTSARVAELAAALVRFAQRVQPLVDARDRVASALATTRAELLLETFDRRIESLARRLDRLALREELAGSGPLLQLPRAAEAVALLERQGEGSLGAIVVDVESVADASAIVPAAWRALRSGGRLAVATGVDAAGAVKESLERAGFAEVRVDESLARSRPAVLARR